MATARTDSDVVVVGAGISGLVAAREIRRGGASVRVLEARDRVGGKMHTVSIEGCPIDLGAHWIGPTQRRIGALVRELGIPSEPQYLVGEHVMLLGDREITFTGSMPSSPALGVAESALAAARVEVRRRLIDRERPWASRGARRLDSLTLAHWMRGLQSATARTTFEIVSRTVFGAEPAELSLLYFLWYLQSAGGYRPLTEFEGAAQDSRLAGGAQQVCERIAAELSDAVILGSPVRSVEQQGSTAVVRGEKGEAAARRVVIALAPPLVSRIDFTPQLPPARAALNQRVAMGAYMKGVAVYDRPWWRDERRSGLAFAGRGPVQMVVDDSPSDGAHGVLVAFVTGAPARDIGRLDAGGRRALVLDAMARLFGPGAASPIAYRDLNWLEEQWSGGAPVGVMGPGTLTGLGRHLRESAGMVHWAGTETATEWNGYMDGAIQAGQRAAREVLAALGNDTTAPADTHARQTAPALGS